MSSSRARALIYIASWFSGKTVRWCIDSSHIPSNANHVLIMLAAVFQTENTLGILWELLIMRESTIAHVKCGISPSLSYVTSKILHSRKLISCFHPEVFTDADVVGHSTAIYNHNSTPQKNLRHVAQLCMTLLHFCMVQISTIWSISIWYICLKYAII